MTSKGQQVTEVIEGLGLGMAAVGATRVTTDKADLERALGYAWSSWGHSADYPLIERVQKPENELRAGISGSSRRTNAAVVWREGGDSYVVDIALVNRTPEEAARFVGSRPLEEWTLLAELFLSAVNPGDVPVSDVKV
ncbi:hypothetical protein ACIGB8_23915 [Promicromonospora sukumoe]|uniref:Uncharacterized protein n=1 Tax=Promicromonospora sukumoe TaxID=88382 RepID=A0A7W3PG85_9MICO|nr:hypothetical protein [Promicromonospora sukumoe]MBA8810930.1 hypothetical protein [Promicromonospora sukumoe]